MGMRSLAVSIALVLATSALAGCGSNDSTANELARQDQVRQARADAARAQRQSDKLQQLEQQVKTDGGSGGAPVPASPSTSSGSTPSSTGTHPCGGGLSAGSNTTCGFARNVQSAYNDTGGGDETVTAYSTATGKIYTMTCHATGSGHECHGGNSASVYFP